MVWQLKCSVWVCYVTFNTQYDVIMHMLEDRGRGGRERQDEKYKRWRTRSWWMEGAKEPVRESFLKRGAMLIWEKCKQHVQLFKA